MDGMAFGADDHVIGVFFFCRLLYLLACVSVVRSFVFLYFVSPPVLSVVCLFYACVFMDLDPRSRSTRPLLLAAGVGDGVGELVIPLVMPLVMPLSLTDSVLLFFLNSSSDMMKSIYFVGYLV